MSTSTPREPQHGQDALALNPTTEAAWRRRFRAPRLTRPRWALDRPNRLVYNTNRTGKWELYTWDTQADAHRQVTDRPRGTLGGGLDPLGKWVWWFDDDHGSEFGRWIVEPFEGGPARPASAALAPGYGAGVALGRTVAVLGSATDAGVALHRIVPASPDDPPAPLYAHHEHAWVCGLTRDETLICLAHSEHGDSRHPALRILDLAGRTIADLWDGPGVGLEPVAWSPVAGDQRLLVLHERAGLLRPLIWSVATDEVREIDVDLPGELEASWYPDGSALLLTHDYRGRHELYRKDLSTRSGDGLTHLEMPAGTIAEARVRPDGEIWYVWTRSSTPPEVRADGKPLLPSGVDVPAGVAYTDHTVGDVHVFLAEPSAPRPHPTIFQIHGGPEAHDRDAFSALVQAWVDHGFAVVLVNYRGSTGYGKAWRDALRGNPGLTELADIARVHDWVTGAGIADPARIVLSGGSWGGYLTLLGLGIQPERWSLGIGAVPVADYVAAYEDEMEPLKAFDRAVFGGSPEEIPEVYRERSPITYIEQVRVPVLILAGENDPRCPIRQIENYIERLRALGKPHEVYRYDAGHGSLVIDETIRQVERQIAFVSRHLGTRAPL